MRSEFYDDYDYEVLSGKRKRANVGSTTTPINNDDEERELVSLSRGPVASTLNDIAETS